MAQVAIRGVPHECLLSSKVKRNSFRWSGRRGSGGILCPQVLVNDERSDEPTISRLQERAAEKQSKCSEPPCGPHTIEQRHFTSTGRGGSGNIQRSASGLENHPLTASIISQHNALQAQYEEYIRKNHAESKATRSSGRGGSGNISDMRRRSRSQGPSSSPKQRFFTTKGRETGTKCCEGVTRAQNGEEDGNADKRHSRATYSSGGSGSLESRYGQEFLNGNALTSRYSVIDPCCEETIRENSGKRQRFLFRWGKISPSANLKISTQPESPRSPTISVYSPSLRAGPLASSSRVSSPTPVIFEDQEYVSFLEL